MMTIASETGMPVDALIADYATGALGGAMSVLVEAHLELSPRNRRYLRDLDALGGVMLAEAPPVALTDRDARLAAIFADNAAPDAIVARPAPPADPVLPPALRRFVGRPFADLAWKARLPGIRECRLDGRHGEASLMWIKGNRAVPAHTHPGLEAVLVLQGGFTDGRGQFERGDIAVADETINHSPVADEEGCICFMVEEGPIQLTGLLGRIFQRLAGS